MVTQEELEQMSPEEIAELQKKNCIFCKIIAGEVPSNKVFEDDHVASFLDINPATKGHVLVMPKEHAPILPLIPPHVFQAMFKDAKLIARGIKEALLVNNITLFVANGAIAGQQASHFLFHIVPRENGDNLHNFSLSPKPDLLKDQEGLLPALKNNLPLMMQNHFKRLGISPPSQSPASAEPAPQEANISQTSPVQQAPITPEEAAKKRELILKILDENKDARDLLRKSPEEFQQLLTQNAELQSIFAGVDLVTLSEKLKQVPEESFSQSQEKSASQVQQSPTVKPAPVQANVSQPVFKPEESSDTQAPTSAAMEYASQSIIPSEPKAPVKSAIFLGEDPIAQRDKVLSYFDEKQKAKELFITDLEKFKSLLAARPDIQEIFKDINLEKLSVRLKEIQDREQGGDS